jgi:hypothetical protein
MESIAQIAEILFRGLVEDERELLAWQQHADIIDILRLEAPSEEDLSELESLTLKWKKLMVKLYGGVVEWRQHKWKGKKRRRKKMTTKDAATARMVKARRRQAATSSQAGTIEEESEEEDHGNHEAEEEGVSTAATAKEKPLSFSFPNFEWCEHWAEQIRFLGPVWFQVRPSLL